MNKIAKYVATALLATGLTFGGGTSAPATAAEEPCAGQQAKVTKAEDALARVTAVFARQQAKVKHAKEELAEADTKGEKTKAAKGLAKALERKTTVKKAKKAQLMRLQKAQQRLDECLAAQEPVEG